MSHHILIIEDNKDMAENIAEILELANYKVTTALNGKIGVEYARQIKPDLIICDIMMPELDGFGVIHILNNDIDTCEIPFIFLTAKAESKDFRTGMNLGADDYITKPFDSVDLLQLVEMRLKKKDFKRYKGTIKKGLLYDYQIALKEITSFTENRPKRTFKKREHIFMEGQNPNELFYIDSGIVKSYKMTYETKELITYIHREGDFLGHVALLEETPYNESTEVIDEVVLSVIPKQDFLSLMYSGNEAARYFMKLICAELDEMENRLLDISYKSVRQRVAGALIRLKEINSALPFITLSRKDIAHIVGTATESLNRTLSDFKEEGHIEIYDEGIRIINLSALKKLYR